MNKSILVGIVTIVGFLAAHNGAMSADAQVPTTTRVKITLTPDYRWRKDTFAAILASLCAQKKVALDAQAWIEQIEISSEDRKFLLSLGLPQQEITRDGGQDFFWNIPTSLTKQFNTVWGKVFWPSSRGTSCSQRITVQLPTGGTGSLNKLDQCAERCPSYELLEQQ